MKKTIIAAALVSLFYVSDAMAQGRRGQRNATPADSSQTMQGRGNREMLAEKDLPANAVSAIKSQYPNAEMKRIVKNKEGNFNVVVAQADKTRRMLVVDTKGSIVTDREMPARNGKGQGQKNKK